MPIHYLTSSSRLFVGALRGTALFAAALAASAVMAAAPPVAPPAPAPASPPAATGMAAPLPHGAQAAKKAKPAAPVKLVDINSASRAELKKLPGVGDAEADKIIANRPFLSKAELVTKGVMPAGPYLSLKTRVIAMQKTMPKPAPKPAPTKP